MTASRQPCATHARYFHVCAACRSQVPAPKAPAPVAAVGRPRQTPMGTPPAPPFPNYADDDPRAYPPVRPSRLIVKGAVQL